ncbi:hypothetical protein BJP36_17755 [Moorena producens JHB]|uniref:VCBS repeat-containing protein n=1 Tax=Moorena producens (strain JHB) TaxID=1454205 RepID=A0A1D9G1I5_MOOP1|nr:hypothetical protein [Moorena producens]AOY81483.2 hypothetical protein BJP36_17755 [Moorena producens JHB]
MFSLGSTTPVGDFRVDTNYLVTDVNGDGQSDLVELWNDTDSFFAATWISNGQGGFNFGGNTRVGDFRVDTNYLVTDVNGDGESDLVELWNDTDSFFAATWISDGQGDFDFGGNTRVGDFRVDTNYLVTDVNGDGESDLVELWNDTDSFFAATWISDGQGDFDFGGNTRVGDFRVDTNYLVTDVNGDGESDLVELWNDTDSFFAATWISDGDGDFDFGGNTRVGDFRVDTNYLVTDVNGDGESDLVELWNDTDSFFAATWISDGDGDFDFGGNTRVGDFRVDTDYLVTDVNGDGQSDLVELWNNTDNFFAATWISDGLGGFSFGSNTQVGDFRVDTDYLVTDLNGDAQSDLVELWNDTDKFFATSWLS